MLVALGEHDAAVEQLEIARQRRPDEPELIVDHATAEALRGRRQAALRILKDREFSDPAPAHMARARAHHYSGEFVPAAREYECFLETRPHDELASYELVECLVRNNDIAGARRLLDVWPEMARDHDWSNRIALERHATAPRIRAGGVFFSNSLDYERWDAGFDFRFRPEDELEVDLAFFHGWFDQDGFSPIDRRSGRLGMHWQPDSYWGLSGNIGVNDYSNGWTSLVGGMGLMLRPVSTLELSVGAERLDVVDSEHPFGMSIYSLGTTIGAVGGRATMDALTFSSKWTPVENVDLFGKYRVGELSDNNRFNELYGTIAYTLARDPSLRLGYGIGYMDVDDPAPLYIEGGNDTNYYYDPEHKVTHNLYVEHARNLTANVRFGAEAHLLLDHAGGTGAGFLSYIQHQWSDHQAVRIDARYFTQDGSRDRSDSSAGNYDALNFFVSYEYRF